MKQKEIWSVNFNPIKGREQQGIRPAVVISGNAMNDHLKGSIVCPLSTKIKKYAGCMVLNKDTTNNLKQDSEIITFQLRAVSHERFIRKIGEISDEQLHQILVGLIDILKY